MTLQPIGRASSPDNFTAKLECAAETLWLVMESAPYAAVLIDREGRIVLANAQTEKLFGYARHELWRQSAEILLAARFRSENSDSRTPLFAAPEVQRNSARHDLYGRRRDGSEFPIEITFNAIKTEDGVLSLGAIVDNTERKRVTEAIVRYNERLRILHQIDKALIAGEGPESIAAAALPPLRELLGVGRAIVNLFNLATGEVEWLAAAGRRHVRVGPGVRYSLRFMGDVEALKRGEPQSIDVHALPPGPEVDALLASNVHTYVAVPMIAEGDLIGALSFGGAPAPLSTEQIGIAQEVAAQFAIALAHARLHEHVKRQAQELEIRVRALRESEELLRNAFEHTNVPSVLTGIDHRFLRVNAAFARMFGYSQADMLTMSMIDLTHPDDLAESYAQRERLKSGEVSCFQMEKRYVHKDGHVVWGLANVSLIRDAHGKPMQYVGQVQDITERKQLEEQLRQSQKMDAFGQLAGGVAHDFNNLLTIISGYSEMLLGRLRADETASGMLKEIYKAGERAASLTRQLLAFSRKQVLAPKVLSLNAVVSETEKMLRRLIGEDVSLTTVLAPGLARVKADPGQIEQVIMNLAVNARDAMPRGGKLTVETANVELDEVYTRAHPQLQPGPFVMLAVSDTGIGMDADTKARIFEPFYTTKEIGKGTGLGLAVVHGILKQSGGHVCVYSEPAHGTTFKIYLPAVREDAVAETPLAEESVLHGTETVLLVEDEPGLRSLSRIALEAHGYTVLVASNAEEAQRVSVQHQNEIHLLVSDVIMPGMSGRQLSEVLLSRRPAMKVLYVSGYTDDAVVRHGVLRAESAFLQKPFTLHGLVAKVRATLGREV